MYIGKQIVKGENHYIVCEAKGIYPDAQPYAVIFVFNIFEGKPSIVGIAPINSSAKETICGYAFNWQFVNCEVQERDKFFVEDD